MKSTTQRSMPPMALFELHFAVLTPMLTECSSLNYPCQKQWLPGIRGKQEPRRARSGAPTCSHESLVGLFSHAYQQPAGRQLLWTRRGFRHKVRAEQQEWPFTCRYVKWHNNAWRKTKPTTPLGVGSPSDPFY